MTDTIIPGELQDPLANRICWRLHGMPLPDGDAILDGARRYLWTAVFLGHRVPTEAPELDGHELAVQIANDVKHMSLYDACFTIENARAGIWFGACNPKHDNLFAIAPDSVSGDAPVSGTPADKLN